MRGRGMRFAGLILLLVALFMTWAVLAAAQPAPFTGTLVTTVTPIYGDEDLKPLVKLTIFDPWARVISSDSPWFVVYDSGQVIYRTGAGEDGQPIYAAASLNDDALQALVDSLGVENFYLMDENYSHVFKTDQPTATITVWTEAEGTRSVSVYGELQVDPEARALAPYGFVTAFDQMMNYANSDAQPWLPEMIEVMVWPFDTSDAADWPGDWPALDSPFAVRRERITSVYIDSGQLERYRALAGEAGAVRIDGATYAFALRYPFPHEVTWPTNAAQP